MKKICFDLFLCAASLAFLAASSLAQTSGTAKTGCENNTASKPPATASKTGPRSGSAPGNMGSTGWTGGTGGSHVDASADRSSGSGTQPQTAKGLDPIKDKSAPQPSC
jgi:hypothetical protein